VRFIVDSFRCARVCERRSRCRRGKQKRLLERRLEIVQQRGDFVGLEHGGLDKQRRTRGRHKRRILLDEALDPLTFGGNYRRAGRA
jgi:hypothetical protein